jgi:hypothetical protein
VEVRVAYEHDLAPGVAGDLVRSRRRQWMAADVVEGRGGRHRDSAEQRELVPELRVGGREVERDRVVGVIGGDPAVQLAVARVSDASCGPDDSEEG